VPSALEVAEVQYAAQKELVQATAAAGVAMWQQVDPFALTASWSAWLSRLFVTLRGAQISAASNADTFVDDALRAQGFKPKPEGRVAATAFSRSSSSGGSLESLLMGPVIATKQAIAHGATVPRAMATGQARLEMTLRTQVADASRVAAGVAVAARPKTGYVRMLVGDSCSRCVILAGQFYPYSSGFERHPQCNCVNMPSREDVAGDYTTDPKLAFEQGRVKGLSKADTQAIRDGADMAQVVNAHSGMYVAGLRKLTTSGTSRSATAGRRLRGAPRAMPEQIYRDATSRENALELLRKNGYLL